MKFNTVTLKIDNISVHIILVFKILHLLCKNDCLRNI